MIDAFSPQADPSLVYGIYMFMSLSATHLINHHKYSSNTCMQTYPLTFTHGSVSLNEEQYKIVSADPYEHQRILASAGSGKTTTITARIAWLLTNCNIAADQIVLLTFSRNSAREMLHRVRALVGPVRIWAGTFHALANTILKEMNGDNHETSMLFVDELPVRWMQWMRTFKGRQWVARIRYIVVDEFQDINAIQWRLLETMRHISARMIIVGDDAQNIYTWRGSSAGFLLDFHSLVRGVADYQLKQNYRSTEAIVAVANRVMRGIPTLPWKEHMVAHKKGGAKPDVLFFWRASDEYTWLAKTIHKIREASMDATIAVLSRNNKELYRAEEYLLQNAVDTRFLVFERTDSLHAGEDKPRKGIVDLATFHGSKGLEWDYVFVLSLNDDILPSRKTPHEIIGERRLFYVAVTRARLRMFLTYHGNERSLSRFVREIGYQLLTFHGLAKYALSEFEIGTAAPSLQSLLDGLDGDDWLSVRASGLLPWNDTGEIPIVEDRLLPPGESWRLPTWADQRDFEAFVRLWFKRCCLELRGWKEVYMDPLRERMIFTIRIFQEDIEFWELWKEEFDLMLRHFFADLKRMQPADFGDVTEWAKEHGLDWTQKDLIQATSILAKLRGQIRPLRFEDYSLDEFTIGPTQSVVPTEYRVDVLRSWRRFVQQGLGWRDCLLDIWRLACLDQVADGRVAGLFRAGGMVDNIQLCVPFFEKLETMIQKLLNQEPSSEIGVNPEVLPEGLAPVRADLILGSTLVRVCGERRPDMYAWTEAWLTAHIFVACGFCLPITRIQMIHPFSGRVWSVSNLEGLRAKALYERLLERAKN
jgi:hypothetical protein